MPNTLSLNDLKLRKKLKRKQTDNDSAFGHLNRFC